MHMSDPQQAPAPVPSPMASPGAWHSPAWFGSAALFNMLAAMAAFGHDGRAAIRWGLLAAVALLAGTALRHLAKEPSDEGWREKLTPMVVSLLGIGLLCAVFALVTQWATRQWRGIDLVADLYLWGGGAVAMAWSMALAFVALAAWQATRPVARQRVWPWAVVVAACVLLLGPTLVAERSSHQEPRALFIKRSLPDALREPWSRSVWLSMSPDEVDGRETVKTCVVLERHARLLWGWQTPVDEAHAEQACGEPARLALEAGDAVESPLLQGQVDRYFARVHAEPELKSRGVALEISRLPPAVQAPLRALLTKVARDAYTPFDLALALRRDDDIKRLMPEREQLLPHQRQGLFDVGLGAGVGVARPPEEVEAEQRAQRTQSLVTMGQLGASRETMMTLMSRVIMGGGDTSGRGGHAPFDYFMANRRCDAGYAAYLLGRGIKPASEHAVHLVSTIGLAQYPNISSEFQRDFKAADDSLGLPSASQLPRCIELARFYAKQVTDWSADLSKLSDVSPLGAVYREAAAAVFQWYVRDAEAWRKANGMSRRAGDTTVIGEPELAVEAAHAMLAAQPASFDQYCSWANTWHTWMLLADQRRPQLTQRMRDLAQGWQKERPQPRAESDVCLLAQLPWKTNEYEGVDRGVALLNADLKRLGVPCQGQPRQIEHSGRRLICQMAVAAP